MVEQAPDRTPGAGEAWLDELLTPVGQELLERLAHQDVGPDRVIGLSERLRSRYEPRLVSAALTQTRLRARAGAKFSRAARMWFTSEGLEQASSERLARHRARRYGPFARVADLCSGIGGDLSALAVGRQVVAVDLDPLHLRMAGLNARVYGASSDAVELVQDDVRRVDLDGVEAVFVDPARRAGGRRLRPGESSPALGWCLALAERVPAVAVKAAPGVSLDLVPAGWEVEFVSEGRELKEATLWSPALATTPRRATLLPTGLTLTSQPGPAVPCAAPGAFVLDPDPAVTRARLVEELARALGAWKLDPEIAFLSSDRALSTPFGRTLRVEDALPWQLKRLRARLRELAVGAVDLRKRGSAVDVDELRRRLSLRGERRATVLLTRVLGRPWALICSDAEGAQGWPR